MKPNSLTEQALQMVFNSGKFALEQASTRILQCQYDSGAVAQALHYYAKETMPNILPIFPALICLSCKAVGGNQQNAKSVASEMLLITASGDIHDDIIDRSTSKFGRKTLLGKYGKDIALLAGDALSFHGMTNLQNNQTLPAAQRRTIADLVTKSMFEIVKAESLEANLWRKKDVTPLEHFEVINHKGCVAELHCRIGGIVGGAAESNIESLARFGRAIGVLSTVKEEFVDLDNFSELRHRIKHELPPYPMLYALQNKRLKKQISTVTEKKPFTKENSQFIAETVLASAEVKKLVAELKKMGKDELANNSLLKDNESAKELTVLLDALASELA